jgi:hypothetical protein
MLHVSASKLDPREQLFRIPGPRDGMSLFLRFLPAENTGPRRPVLYVHGATFPSALSIAHRFDGEIVARCFGLGRVRRLGPGLLQFYPDVKGAKTKHPEPAH